MSRWVAGLPHSDRRTSSICWKRRNLKESQSDDEVMIPKCKGGIYRCPLRSDGERVTAGAYHLPFVFVLLLVSRRCSLQQHQIYAEIPIAFPITGWIVGHDMKCDAGHQKHIMKSQN